MIDQMYLMLYNLLFTSLPPIAIGKIIIWVNLVLNHLINLLYYIKKNQTVGTHIKDIGFSNLKTNIV